MNDIRTNREHQAYGSRPDKANFTTRYSFSEGRLKGLFAGGAYIYQSPQIMSGASPVVVDYGRNIECTNLFAGKLLRLPWQHLSAIVQLNVNNIFDQRVVAPGQYTQSTQGTANPVLRRVLLRTPREFRLTATLNF